MICSSCRTEPQTRYLMMNQWIAYCECELAPHLGPSPDDALADWQDWHDTFVADEPQAILGPV